MPAKKLRLLLGSERGAWKGLGISNIEVDYKGLLDMHDLKIIGAKFGTRDDAFVQRRRFRLDTTNCIDVACFLCNR